VKVGDEIEVRMGQRTLKLRVLSVSEHAAKEEAAGQYQVIE
jgi:ribosomal 50S subunit-recycling heat shock protein